VVEATLRDAAGRPAIRCAFRIIYRSTYVRLAVSSSPTCMPTCTSTRQPDLSIVAAGGDERRKFGPERRGPAVLRFCPPVDAGSG